MAVNMADVLDVAVIINSEGEADRILCEGITEWDQSLLALALSGSSTGMPLDILATGLAVMAASGVAGGEPAEAADTLAESPTSGER
jgi:hypothetical protein